MNKALLLDRDGVINKEIHYLHKKEDVEFIDGIFETCQFFMEKGYLIIVITNQAGIGRGLYSEQEFAELSHWMIREFSKRQVVISKIYHCPDHPTEGKGCYRRDSFDRKPNPGMIFKARDEFDLSLEDSILVGDKETDIEAGINAGVGTNILVCSGHALPEDTQADMVLDSIKALPQAL
ncbi:HAD family hydrolase [candidate division KSB1 bacterium]|nr:HAD family hydrolase [candidate division KSB1 bacterium]NIR68786.1 HAD family hydrolase [candidate division KSB1 bacterium]NIS28118.1 HAD family hydrolase [candidate division KSB1 bacterium]NIT75014.1 HAD family hydrolase [candidate division KSB1 bacterium]NIU28798.1 HAD family hydrolase [candidate division KSB1 bacterium]